MSLCRKAETSPAKDTSPCSFHKCFFFLFNPPGGGIAAERNSLLAGASQTAPKIAKSPPPPRFSDRYCPERLATIPIMIHESHPWEKQILADADVICRWAAKSTAPDRRYMILERKIFVSAFSMRKLIENNKLTDRTKKLAVPCRAYPFRGTHIDFLNFHRLDEHYNFSKEKRVSMNIKSLANQIIHSRIFHWQITEDCSRSPVSDFLVSSDHAMKKALYAISINDYISALRAIGKDVVNKIIVKRKENEPGHLIIEIR